MPFRHLDGVEVCRFKAGDYLMRRGEVMSYVYYLKKGAVKREILTREGSTLIVTIKESGAITGSIVGLLEIFDQNFNGYCSDDFIAETGCLCYRIPVSVCKAYLRSHPALLEEALVMCIGQFDLLEAAYSKKKDMSAVDLVCEFLLSHDESGDEGILVPKKYTNVEIGKYLGIHSVTVSRIINCLRHDGCVVRTSQGLKLIDEAGIRMYLCGEKKMKYD
ncbi:MAG: Crp/Fnr family transcriptional regulator [Peptococcaceae bacterium]